MPKPSSRPSSPDSRSRVTAIRPPVATEPPPTVSGRWLIAALALTVVAAALCSYGALCLLFYQGQWQLLFHPSRAVTTTPASAGLPFDDIHFDVTDTGVPRLDGWWIPAAPQAPWSSATVLYLHGSRGSLSDCVPALAALHELGVNVFAIDYQGFGRSAGRHPTERLLDDDSAAAWAYLTHERHIPARAIVVYGDGVGATLAALLAARFAPAGVVLQDPNPTARRIFLDDARARILPLFLLQKEFLDPAADLARAHSPLPVPRLFLDVHTTPARTVPTGPFTPAFSTPAGPARNTRAQQLFELSSSPKQYFDLRRAPAGAWLATLRRFLDEVLH
jgi:acetyl esterase/lipase